MVPQGLNTLVPQLSLKSQPLMNPLNRGVRELRLDDIHQTVNRLDPQVLAQGAQWTWVDSFLHPRSIVHVH